MIHHLRAVLFAVYEMGRIVERDPPAQPRPRVRRVVMSEPLHASTEPSGLPRSRAATYNHDGQAGTARSQLERATRVSQLMSSPVITIGSQQPGAQAAQVMRAQGCHHLPVVDDGQLVGIISDRDLLRHLGTPGGLERLQIRSLMSTTVVTAAPDTSIRDAAAAMVQWTISCLPVLDRPHNLVGILTSAGMLRCIVHEAPLDLWV